MGSASQEASIVGIDLLQGVFGSASEMQRIRRPQKNCGGQVQEDSGDALNDRSRKGQPSKGASLAVFVEFGEELTYC
jgi:hypothetical protein